MFVFAPKALLEHNAKVYMASRSKDKALAAIEDLKNQTGKEALFLELDLGSLSAIRRAAEEFLRYERVCCHFRPPLETSITARRTNFIFSSTTRKVLK